MEIRNGVLKKKKKERKNGVLNMVGRGCVTKDKFDQRLKEMEIHEGAIFFFFRRNVLGRDQ